MTYLDMIGWLAEISVATVLSVLIMEHLHIPVGLRNNWLVVMGAHTNSIWIFVLAFVMVPLLAAHPWGLIVGAPTCLGLWLYRP